MNNSLEDPPIHSLLIGIVGVCASGKSTMVRELKEQGYKARHIAQEHSFVKDMWKRITNPDILIYLEASYLVTIKRRQIDWTQAEWAEQLRRLEHAREHANLIIFTDDLTSTEVLKQSN